MGDMRNPLPIGYPGGIFRITEKKLQTDPEAERDPCPRSKENAHSENSNPVIWKKKNIRSENAADGARSSDQRHLRTLIHINMRQRGADSGKKIKNEEFYFSEVILDAITEDKKEKHIESDVRPAAMQKKRPEKILEGKGTRKKIRGDDAVIYYRIEDAGEFEDKNNDISADKRIGNDRLRSGLGGFISDWKKHIKKT